MKIVSCIPVRSGSKGILNKNISLIGGHPLMSYVIRASVDSSINATYTLVDTEEYARISDKYNAIPVARPDYTCTDLASTESALLYFANHIDFDVVVLLQATSPLTTAADINSAVQLINKYDSVVSVCKDHGGWLCGGFRWDEAGNADYDPINRPRRQDMKSMYRENGAIYVTTKDALLKSGSRLSGNIGLYVMPRQRSFEIDEYDDLVEISKILL